MKVYKTDIINTGLSVHRVCTPVEDNSTNPIHWYICSDDITIRDLLKKVAGKVFWRKPLKGGKYENSLSQVVSLEVHIAPFSVNLYENKSYSKNVVSSLDFINVE